MTGITTSLIVAAMFVALAALLHAQRRSRANSFFRGSWFVLAAMVMVTLILFLQNYVKTAGAAHFDEEVMSVHLTVALYVIPAVCAAIGANLYTQFVLGQD